MADDPLSKPIMLAGHTLKHRVVLAPMTRMRASVDGIPNPSAALYYAERASLGGLLISEGIVIDLRGRGFPNTPGLWNDEQMRAWQPITRAVKQQGALFFAQLWHVGRVSVPSQTGGSSPISATSKPLPGNHLLFGQNNSEAPYVDGESMSSEQINAVIRQFADAAKRAIDAGFDGVEIHGGNGYLLDTFVHSNINDRTDSYGGCLSNRLRFPLQVIDAVVDAVGAHRTAIRIAPFHVLQQTLDEDRITTFSEYSSQLEKRELAYVHMVEPRYDQLSTETAFYAHIRKPARCSVASKEAHNSNIDPLVGCTVCSLWTFRKLFKSTLLIGAGGYDGQSAREAIDTGRVDLVAFGRYFTSNPDLPQRLTKHLPLTKYDRTTFYTPFEDGYLGWKKFGEV